MIELRWCSPVLRDPKVFAETVRAALGSLVALNEATLRAFPGFPRLYDSGVRFQGEDPERDTFVDASCCLAAGHGDCAHLAAWLAAERRVRDRVAATLAVSWHVLARPDDAAKWKRLRGRESRHVPPGWQVKRGFHVMVRLPASTNVQRVGAYVVHRDDRGYVEDPSRALGMGKGKAA